jgi:hypothetical protein
MYSPRPLWFIFSGSVYIIFLLCHQRSISFRNSVHHLYPRHQRFILPGTPTFAPPKAPNYLPSGNRPGAIPSGSLHAGPIEGFHSNCIFMVFEAQ